VSLAGNAVASGSARAVAVRVSVRLPARQVVAGAVPGAGGGTTVDERGRAYLAGVGLEWLRLCRGVLRGGALGHVAALTLDCLARSGAAGAREAERVVGSGWLGDLGAAREVLARVAALRASGHLWGGGGRDGAPEASWGQVRVAGFG